MKNYKPKVRELQEYQIDALNNLGFFVLTFPNHREKIDKRSNAFEKLYSMCGGSFRLFIRLDGYYFGDDYMSPCVKMKTPYDSWWSDTYNVKDFADEVKEFLEELNRDIGMLLGLGIIEEDNDNESINLETYIIQTTDGEEYHIGDGNMTNKLQSAEFYATEEMAKDELSCFDEPDEFEIKKIIVNLSYDKEE
jgi:hypothetical protein